MPGHEILATEKLASSGRCCCYSFLSFWGRVDCVFGALALGKGSKAGEHRSVGQEGRDHWGLLLCHTMLAPHPPYLPFQAPSTLAQEGSQTWGLEPILTTQSTCHCEDRQMVGKRRSWNLPVP